MRAVGPDMTRGLTPRRRLRRPMVLTPLVDIVFLLLTFFMLSSQLSPFSLVPIDRPRSIADADGRTSANAAGTGRSEALLSVRRASVRLNGTPIEPSALPAALAGERRAGTDAITILTDADATVQDFVAALEAAKIAAFASISIANMR